LLRQRIGVVVAVGSVVGCFFVFEVEGGVDERDVGESLGEVADQAFAVDVVFLGEQAKVVAEGKETVEERAGVAFAADGFEGADHPETAGEESAFAGREAVLDYLGVVAEDEAAVHQFALDGFDGASDAAVGGG
jgi:hypothetical protein